TELRAGGCVRITLDTTAPLERAVAFYERNGFARTGRVRDFFGMPLHEYGKTLGGGSPPSRGIESGAVLMPTPDDLTTTTPSGYNAAADQCDAPANSFWDRFGRGTVDRLKLRAGARVLDVCCGAGASAIPAAERAGSGGSVLGIDLAENLLDLARAKALS